jgi:hypothetical protein
MTNEKVFSYLLVTGISNLRFLLSTGRVMSKIESQNRMVNKLSRNQHSLAAILLLLILVIFYRDVVFKGKTFLMETAAPGTMPNAGPYNYKGVSPRFAANDAGAIAWQIEPFNRFISTSLKKGDFPLWNPYAGLAGSPLLADGHTGPLEPIQFFFFFVPARYWPYAVDIQLLVRFFLAGYFCYLFVRRQGISFWGSVTSGTLFMLSSYFVSFGNHPEIKTEVLLPLVLYGYDRLVDLKDKLGFWFCALFIGWAIIAAMPEATFFSLFLGTLWYFYKSMISWLKAGMIFTEARNRFLKYVGSTVLGFLISAVYLLPFLEFVLFAKSGHSEGSVYPWFPLWALPNLVFQVQGYFFLHLGVFALFTLFLSLLYLKDWPAEDRQLILFFGSYAVIFMFVPYDFPLTNWIRSLPVFDQVVLTKYSIPSIIFCLAVLVGNLIDRIKHTSLSYIKSILSLLAIYVLFINLPSWSNPAKSLSVYFADKNSMYAAFIPIISLSIIWPLLIFVYQRQRISTRVMQISLLFLVGLEPFFWSGRIHRPDRVDPFQVPPFVEYLRDDKEPFRIFGLDGILYPNISTAYRVADIRWLNAMVPQRAFDFSTKFIQTTEPWTIRLTGTILPVSDGMFDLLNVKYVLFGRNSSLDALEICSSEPNTQPDFGRNTIHSVVLSQNSDKLNQLLETPININGVTRTTLLAQTPQQFSVKLNIPQTLSTLDFSIGLDPDVFLPEYGDGVTFKVTLLNGNKTRDLYSRYIDPKNNPCHRKWFDESIDLAPWAGKEVILNFFTDPGPTGNISWDWAYWGAISLSTKTASDQSGKEQLSYERVYRDRNVLIYRNKDVSPRAFVVYNVVNVSSLSESLEQMASSNIDLNQTAVVENLPVELVNSINKTGRHMQAEPGNAKLVNSGELTVEVNAKAAGLLIVTDQYYPGWNAYVDGQRRPIYPVDGIFRGVFLEPGNHQIEFKYRPFSFIFGGIISTISLIGTIFFLIFYTRFSQKHDE